MGDWSGFFGDIGTRYFNKMVGIRFWDKNEFFFGFGFL